MAAVEENILQDLFGNTNFNDISAEEFEQVVQEHPYYGIAHFLFAKKLYLDKNHYQPALQKAALHFPNELLLHFNLNNHEEQTTVELPPAVEQEAINEIPQPDVNIDALGDNIIAEPQEDIPVQEPDLTEDEVNADIAVNEKLSNLLQQQAAAFENPVEPEAELPVENTPYHRVDYFDSQGIKLEESNSNDKLGTQLKRFTDWLKQMKRIHPNPAALDTDEAGEHQVENIAAYSNEPKEIVTEAMAEVLIKQGKPQQAIQIYEKLSFNNPSKTAYFAAKIDELKR